MVDLHFISVTKQPSGSIPKNLPMSTAWDRGGVKGIMAFYITKVVRKLFKKK